MEISEPPATLLLPPGLSKPSSPLVLTGGVCGEVAGTHTPGQLMLGAGSRRREEDGERVGASSPGRLRIAGALR